MTTKSSIGGTATSPLQWADFHTGTDGKSETVNGVERTKWNDFSCTHYRAVRTVGKRNASGTPVDVWMDATCPPSALLTANDILTLQGRLAESVKGHQFNLAVSAAQGKQTVNMVVDAVSSIGGAIRDLKRGKFESAARRFGVNQKPSKLSEKDVSGRWLELQYGWLPLLSDVHEAAKAYESITSGRRTNRVSVSLVRRSEGDSSCAKTVYTCKGPLEDRMKIIYEMSETLSQERSLGLTDPLSVAWELIPYSFVVDWFIPIGDYLENLNTIPHLTGRFMTIRRRRFRGSAVWVDPAYKWFEKPKTHFEYHYSDRVISSALTVPKPGFNSIPDAMSPNRIWNAIALAVQKIR